MLKARGMHIQIPSPTSGGLSPASPYSHKSNSPLIRDRNHVELEEFRGDEVGQNHQHPFTEDLSKRPPSLPPREPACDRDDNSGWWLFEIIAWVVSAAALAAIIIILAVTDEKPLPQWPMSITLNSVISCMSTLMKAALIIPVAESISQLKWVWFKKAESLEDIQTFDEASRGTWGSLKLLFRTKRLHLAKLGAFITILTLGVDPFIQQVIVYPTRAIPSTMSNASVPLALGYSDYTFGVIMAIREPTLGMKSAINNGVYDTNDHPQNDFALTPQCATGNCTWPETYHSLAVCSKCANTTSLINKKCDDTSGFITCNYSLPNGMFFNGLNRGRLYMNASSELKTVNFNNTQSTISSVNTMRGLHDASSSTLFGVVSNECVLYFCVNEYHAEVSNGDFKETVIATYTGEHDPVYGQNITIMVPPSGKRTYAQKFVVESEAWRAIHYYFSDFWTGNVTGQTGERSTSNDVLSALYDLGEDGSGLGTQKPGAENDTIAAVAASMTKYLRLYEPTSKTSANRNDATAVGTAWTGETFVHVRWEWIILPVVLEGLALVFLIGTIVQSKVSGIALWKSSTLPMLEGKVRSLQGRFADYADRK
ncbi:hypothetical protein F5Y05DRAFT_341383 [Hypoxylon sp. FL0543]|nr:hypothetical protein F5Y05DRAFT_341383 [Hypoxylon sp. FL0543]